MKTKTFTSYVGNNDVLLEAIANMYLTPGDRIADVTFGQGVFWKKIDLTQYDFHPSDLITVPEAPYNFTDLPYQDAVFDVVVLDPPYVANPRKDFKKLEGNYKNTETTHGFKQDDIMQLYYDGMDEAKRILKKKGLMMVKCKDIKTHKQCWSHIDIYNYALSIGLKSTDMFILTPFSTPIVNPNLTQRCARKNHSYMWIFQKC